MTTNAFSATASSIVKTSSAFVARDTFKSFAAIVGDEHVEDESNADGTFAVSPASAEEAREVVRLAVSSGLGVVPAGACTWLDVGNEVRGRCVIVKTERLSRVVAHEPADLVATAEAGLSLADFNRAVGRSGQCLPLDPPDDARSTLGGVAATASVGAQGFGYGVPRSHVLGMSALLADGRIIRVGSRVVKNVAGYDLCKLFVGSYGTLGLILELTFKLRPRPPREATLVARARDAEATFGAARALVGAQLLPVAVEILSPRMAAAVGLQVDEEEFALLARFAGTAAAVEFQLARAAELIETQTPKSRVEVFDEDAALWTALAAAPLRRTQELVWRACVLPSNLGALLNALPASAAMWHAGAGDGRLRVFDSLERGEALSLSSLRNLREAARASGGSLVVEHAPVGLKREFDAWGLTESSSFLMSRVKAQLDPSDTFSPGRFYV